MKPDRRRTGNLIGERIAKTGRSRRSITTCAPPPMPPKFLPSCRAVHVRPSSEVATAASGPRCGVPRIVEAIIDNHAQSLLKAEVDLPPGIRLAVWCERHTGRSLPVDRAGGVALGGRDCRIAKSPRLPPIVCPLDPTGFHLVAIERAAGRLANEEGHQRSRLARRRLRGQTGIAA